MGKGALGLSKNSWKILALFEVLVAGLLPCALLLNLGSNFRCYDWFNNLWMIGYMGEYFREHLAFPAVFNTVNYVGMPYPVFYGFGFYRFLGIFGGFVAPQLLLRLFVFVGFSLQHLSILGTLLKLKAPRWFASAVAFVVTLSIYPLTNLYSRGAFPELFANFALTIALCLLFLILESPSFSKRLVLALTFVLVFCFCCLTHPITALYGLFHILLFSVLAIYWAWEKLKNRQSIIWLGLFTALLILLIVSPWAFVTLEFLNKIEISTTNVFEYINSVDTFWSRIYPLPDDPRVVDWSKMWEQVSTPFLDAQANIYLLGLWGAFWLLMGKGNKSHGVSIFLFSVFLFWAMLIAFSVEPHFLEYLPNVFRLMQFAYRFVSYQNLTAFFGILGLVFLWNQRLEVKNSGRAQVATGFLVLMVSIGFGLKLIHSNEIRIEGDVKILTSSESRESTLRMADTFFGWWDYGTPNQFQAVTLEELHKIPQLRFVPQAGAAFGLVPPLEITIINPGWYLTNIQAFSWNKMRVNNEVVDNLKVLSRPKSSLLAVKLPRGTHRLTYDLEVPMTWKVLCILSFGASLCVMLVLAICGVLGLSRPPRPSA